jgi:hypothetical protein
LWRGFKYVSLIRLVSAEIVKCSAVSA